MKRPNTHGVPLEFDPLIKFLHWPTLFLIVAVFLLAFSIDLVPSTAKQRVLELHRSVGVTIWVVTLGRLVWRQFTRPRLARYHVPARAACDEGQRICAV